MKLNFLELDKHFIFDQLQIEEALLRSDDENWCIVNSGSKDAIVMGSSGKVDDLLDLKKVRQNKTPIIKRFSGGGTVYVDEDTLFVSFIFNHQGFDFKPFPEPILRWTENFYKKALELDGFALKENDYTIDNNKCGGNAQYIRKNRWLHHSSFLWDYKTENMSSLLFPPKAPIYRKKRSHKDFLCSLRSAFPTKNSFIQKIKSCLRNEFDLKQSNLEKMADYLRKTHKKTLTFVKK